MNNGTIYACAAVIGCLIARTIQHFRWGRCKNLKSLAGKTIIITGANSGIGKEVVKELARRDAKVILACRDLSSGFQAVNDIRKVTNKGELIVMFLNLASFKSVRQFAEAFRKMESKLDILVNNAGIYQCPLTRTDDGFETQFAVNYLGHFLLTDLLLENLQASDDGRVLVVTSSLYRKGKIDFANLNGEKYYSKSEAYANSKLANILFGLQLDKILRNKEKSNVSVHMISPGIVWTNLGRHVKWSWWKKVLVAPLAFLFVKTPNEGCQTVVHCAVTENLPSGRFYRNCKEVEYDKVALDTEMAEKLWDHTLKLIPVKKDK